MGEKRLVVAMSRRARACVERSLIPGHRILAWARLLVVVAMVAGIGIDLVGFVRSWMEHSPPLPATARSLSVAARTTTSLVLAILVRTTIIVLAARASMPRSRSWYALLIVIALMAMGGVASPAIPVENLPLAPALALVLIDAVASNRKQKGSSREATRRATSGSPAAVRRPPGASARRPPRAGHRPVRR